MFVYLSVLHFSNLRSGNRRLTPLPLPSSIKDISLVIFISISGKFLVLYVYPKYSVKRNWSKIFP